MMGNGPEDQSARSAISKLFEDVRKRLVETGTRNRLITVNRINTRGNVSNNICGTTGSGRKSGRVVYKLAKPAAGGTAWTESVIYTFRGGALDGANPAAPLAMDSNATLYGTTIGGGIGGAGGTIFRLLPPTLGRTAWLQTILYRFSGEKGTNSVGRLVIGKDSALYGTAYTALVYRVSRGKVVDAEYN